VDARQSRDHKYRIRELERQLRRKDAALAETAAFLVLRKKLNAYWGGSEDVGNGPCCQNGICSLIGWPSAL